MKENDLVKLILELDEYCKKNICSFDCKLFSGKGCLFREYNFYEIISKIISKTYLGEIWFRFETKELANDFEKQLEIKDIVDFPYFPCYEIVIYVSDIHGVKKLSRNYIVSKEKALEYKEIYGDDVIFKSKGETK